MVIKQQKKNKCQALTNIFKQQIQCIVKKIRASQWMIIDIQPRQLLPLLPMNCNSSLWVGLNHNQQQAKSFSTKCSNNALQDDYYEKLSSQVILFAHNNVAYRSVHLVKATNNLVSTGNNPARMFAFNASHSHFHCVSVSMLLSFYHGGISAIVHRLVPFPVSLARLLHMHERLTKLQVEEKKKKKL